MIAIAYTAACGMSPKNLRRNVRRPLELYFYRSDALPSDAKPTHI